MSFSMMDIWNPNMSAWKCTKRMDAAIGIQGALDKTGTK